MSQEPTRDIVAVYLLHFSEKIGDTQKPRGYAQHYVGYCKGESVEKRVDAHRSGQGARMCAAAIEQGADIILARVWPEGGRDLEKWIKRQKRHARFCPECNR